MLKEGQAVILARRISEKDDRGQMRSFKVFYN